MSLLLVFKYTELKFNVVGALHHPQHKLSALTVHQFEHVIYKIFSQTFLLTVSMSLILALTGQPCALKSLEIP